MLLSLNVFSLNFCQGTVPKLAHIHISNLPDTVYQTEQSTSRTFVSTTVISILIKSPFGFFQSKNY